MQITSRNQFEIAWYKHEGVVAKNYKGCNYWDVENVTELVDGHAVSSTKRLKQFEEFDHYFADTKLGLLLNGIILRMDNTSICALCEALCHFLEYRCVLDADDLGGLRKAALLMLSHIFNCAFDMIENPSVEVKIMPKFEPSAGDVLRGMIPPRVEAVCFVIDPSEACCSTHKPIPMLPYKLPSEKRFIDRRSVLEHFVPDAFFPISPSVLVRFDPEEPASEVSCSELDTCDPDWVQIVLDGVLRDAAANLLDLKTRKITKRLLHIIKLRGERAARILTGFKVVRTHAMKTRAR